MLQTMTIAFREGMEAFLIVAISLAYFVRTGRPQFKTPVYYGIAASVLLSITLGYALRNASENPLMEGILALTAGVMVGTFTIHMIRASKSIGKNIRNSLEAHASRQGALAAFGVFTFVTLMITREGMETVLMLTAASYGISFVSLLTGVLAGIALAALMGYFWVRKSHLINIGRFLQVTAIFMVLFAAQMFLKGIHEISETGVISGLAQSELGEFAEELTEDGEFGASLVTYMLVVIPLIWLSVVTWRDRMSARIA